MTSRSLKPLSHDELSAILRETQTRFSIMLAIVKGEPAALRHPANFLAIVRLRLMAHVNLVTYVKPLEELIEPAAHERGAGHPALLTRRGLAPSSGTVALTSRQAQP